MSLDCLIGVDVGTSSSRVTVYRLDGSLLSEGRASHHISHPKVGWAEERASDWWEAVCAASRAALNNPDLPTLSVKGLAVTSMRQTFICMDRDMHPVRPGILWYDTRHAALVDWVRSHIGSETVYRLTGSPPGRRAIYKVMWLRDNEPEVYRSTAHILFIPDYIVHCLTGELVTSSGASCASGCLDIAAKTRWATDLIERCGVDPDKWLGDIRPAGSVAGHVSVKAAAQTGFPAGTPVVLTAGDQACGNLGIGVCQPGLLGINGGTSCALQTPSETLPSDKHMSFFVDFSPAGYYVAENGITSGTGALTEWFKGSFCPPETQEPKDQGRLWDELYDLAEQAPAGNLGLMLVPYLRGANGPLWDPRARGLLAGLTTEHNRSHLMRALLEGLAYESRHIIEAMERGTGVPVHSMRTYGGASQNDVWNRTFADILGRPVVVTSDPAPVSLGAAIVAGYAVGLYGNPVDAAYGMIQIRKTFEPDPGRARLYDELYQGGYVGLYERLQDLMTSISRVIRRSEQDAGNAVSAGQDRAPLVDPGERPVRQLETRFSGCQSRD